ncbi:MAG TPA: hypothetical protein VFP89_09100 [Propionibacteriaceae bacterium]|nr:hypothetical protein [Propionibacteriaceae bacterium]
MRWLGHWVAPDVPDFVIDPAWIEADFDDSSWPAATVISATHDGARGESRPPVDPYGAMLPRDIGMLGGDRVTPRTPTLRRAPAQPDLASAGWARERRDAASRGYEDFWDGARGSYVDHIVDGERMPAMSQAAGAVAIVSGLAPRDRWAGIVDVITDPDRLVVRSWIGGADGGYDMTKIVETSQGIYRVNWDVDTEVVLAEPFFSHAVHDAVAAAGRGELLPDLLRRWSVFLQDGLDTFGECWGWGTPVHAWSATPTKDLVWYVLGVTPASPGFAAVRVAPRPGPVERLDGTVPTPHGLVHVQVAGGRVHVDSPVPVTVVPLGGEETPAAAGHSEFAL